MADERHLLGPDVNPSPVYDHHGTASSVGKGKGKARADNDASVNPPGIHELPGNEPQPPPHPIDPGYGYNRQAGGYPTQEGGQHPVRIFSPCSRSLLHRIR